MKQSAIFFTILCTFCLLHSVTDLFANHSNTCVYTHSSSTWKLNGEEHNFQPGDTICLEAGERGPIRIENIHGTAENPIVIINSGGQVITDEYDYGIKVAKSSHIRLTGTGDPEHFYGIQAGGTVFVGELTTEVEIDHIEVYKAGFAGFMIKTDPNCSPSTWRENFTMKNVIVHNNYAHDTEDGEGFYIGYSNFGGTTQTCNGEPITLYAHAIEGLEMYNNKAYNTGAEGIQVGAATINTKIYNNEVRLFGQRPFANFQNGGIQIGEGTGGLMYNNWIEDGPGNGLIMLGRADNIVFNNVIINAGELGIFADERGDPVGDGFKFFNNTIINPGSDGLRIYAELVEMNQFKNNIIVNPRSGIPIKKLSDGVPLDESNNLFADTIAELLFIDPENRNYRLQYASPAHNAGIDASSFGVTHDFDGKSRPQNGSFDIGAFEYTPSLRLTGSASDQKLILNWELDTELSTTATWNIGYEGPVGDQPASIEGLPAETRQYELTGLTNNEMYTVTLTAVDDSVELYTDTVRLFPTNNYQYLPVILR